MELGLSSDTSESYETLADLFRHALPLALLYGMTPEQFWDDDPSLFAAYRKKAELRGERVNREAHLMGAYTYLAINACAPILRAFSKAKKAIDYPPPLGEKPQAQEARNYNRFRSQLKNVADARRERFGRGLEQDGVSGQH